MARRPDRSRAGGRAQRRRAAPPAPAAARRPVAIGGGAIARTVRRHPAFLTAALLTLHLLLAFLVFQPAPHTGGDNGVYVTLARALLEHGRYINLHEPGTPAHTQYPPGFAVVLAAGTLAGLTTWVGMKALVVVLTSLGVAFSFLWIRRRGRPALALGVGLLLAISSGVLDQGHWVLSDGPFWAFTMIAVWGFERLRPERRAAFAIAVAATVAAYFTRSAGLPLVIAAGGFLASRRRWRELALFAAIVGLPALIWWLRARAFGGVDYVNQFWYINPYAPELGTIGALDLVARVIANHRKYLGEHLPILLTGALGPLPVTAAIGVAVFAVFGWIGQVRRLGTTELLLPLYIGLIMVWPAVWSGERFLLPVLPLLLFYAGDALTRAARRIRPGAALPAGALVVLLLTALAVPGLARDIALGTQCSAAYRAGDRYACMQEEWRDFFTLAEWSRAALPDDAIVLSRKPSLFYVASGLPGTYYPLSRDPELFFETARRAGARYVVLDRMDAVSEAYLAPILLRRSAAFCILDASDRTGTALLGIRPDAETSPDAERDDPDAGGVVSFALCGSEYWRDAGAPGGVPPAAER